MGNGLRWLSLARSRTAGTWRVLPGQTDGERVSGQIAAGNQDWHVCREVTRANGRTFFFASHLLPPAQRRAIQAVYAYCRIADDLVDGSEIIDPVRAKAALDAWEHELAHPTHPVAVAFAEARAIYGIPLEPVHDLIDGIRMDLVPARYGTWDALRTYCYHVAGTIGLLVAPILGCRQEGALQHAVDLGIAMQLTNIIRDVGEDAQLGRVYLPMDEMEQFGVSVDQLLLATPTGRFDELIAFQIERARSLYASGRLGIPALSVAGQLTAIACANLYEGILTKVEQQQYDVLTRRAIVPTHQKFAAMPAVARTFILGRLALTS